MIPAAWPYVISLAALAAPLAAFHHPWWAAAPIVAAAGVAFFFRDPERTAPEGEHLVVSPADGRVVEAVSGGEGGGRIGIFLSLFDVHVNRAPVGGTIEKITYRPGSFRPAYEKRASDANERNTLDLISPEGRFAVSQVAGIVARRIACYKSPGDKVARGERIGHIAFGSRTELILPPGAEITVRTGDAVRGGVTVVARLLRGEGSAP